MTQRKSSGRRLIFPALRIDEGEACDVERHRQAMGLSKSCYGRLALAALSKLLDDAASETWLVSLAAAVVAEQAEAERTIALSERPALAALRNAVEPVTGDETIHVWHPERKAMA